MLTDELATASTGIPIAKLSPVSSFVNGTRGYVDVGYVNSHASTGRASEGQLQPVQVKNRPRKQCDALALSVSPL